MFIPNRNKRNWGTLWGGCLFAIQSTLLASSPAGASTVTVQEIGRLASENASLLKAKAQEVVSSRLEAEGAGLLPNPSIAIQVGGLKSGDSSGPTIESTLTQVIPFPGKRATQIRLKEVETKLLESTLEQAKVIVQHEATLRAMQWVVLDEQAKHFQERQKRFRLIRDFLKARPLASPSAKAESYLIEGQIELLEKSFAEIEQEKNSIEFDLRYFLQVTTPLRPQPDWISPESLPKREEGSPQVARSPELRKKQLEVEQAANAVEKAGLQAYPDIALGAGYRHESVSPANQFYYGAIGLSIPIFDRGQYAEPAARAKLDAEKAREGLLRSKILQEVEKAWSRLSSAKELAMKFNLKRISEIDKQFVEVDREFRKGRVNTSVLLQTDAQLHETVGAIYEAQLGLGQRLSDLRLLLGEPLIWK